MKQHFSRFRIIALLAILHLFYPHVGFARRANFEEAPAIFEYFNRDVTVETNGTSNEIITYQVKILNETGRNNFGTQRLYYNGSVQEVQIIEAKTLCQGREYKVPKQMMEIKPLASDVKGFDHLFQVLISFPQAEEGSQLYLKYKVITREVPLANHFSTNFQFGQQGVWEKSSITVNSKLPFYVMVNDPSHTLNIKKSKNKDKGLYLLSITLKKPLYEDIINEQESNFIPNDHFTIVDISTLKTFEDLSKAFTGGYEKVLKQPLPPLLKSIRTEAQKVSGSVGQINTITAQISEKIRYMGDWRSIKGQFCPRDLKTITESRVGDCKDFSALTAVILNSLGYKAKVALIRRGSPYLAAKKVLPSPDLVNHAIVKVIDPAGKVFWIDPTNAVSMADGIFIDIADRPVIVLDSLNPSYESIPKINFKHARNEKLITLELKNNQILHVQGTVKLQGEQALHLAGEQLLSSAQTIKERIIHYLSGEIHPVKKNVILPNLKSRIVRDLNFQYSYDQENVTFLTNNGEGISLDSSWLYPYLDTSEDQVGATYMGSPATSIVRRIIKNVHVKNLKNLNYKIESPWVNIRRECYENKNNNGVELIEHIEVLESFITAKEIKSQKYRDLKNQIKKYFNKVVIIVNRKPDAQSFRG